MFKHKKNLIVTREEHIRHIAVIRRRRAVISRSNTAVSKRGAKKAIGAVAASLLTCAYHMISNGTYYEELGPDHFEKRQSEGRRIKKLVDRFAALGYDVEIKPITA
ncbi:MAG: hypothetical protein AAFR90_14330 [Pseudomonadota bacterium]